MTEPKTPDADQIIELVEVTNVSLIVAALVLGLVIGALIIVMLPDQIVEDTDHAG